MSDAASFRHSDPRWTTILTSETQELVPHENRSWRSLVTFGVALALSLSGSALAGA
jgi:hypothetical protein